MMQMVIAFGDIDIDVVDKDRIGCKKVVVRWNAGQVARRWVLDRTYDGTSNKVVGYVRWRVQVVNSQVIVAVAPSNVIGYEHDTGIGEKVLGKVQPASVSSERIVEDDGVREITGDHFGPGCVVCNEIV